MRLGCYMPSKASMSESKPEFILKIFLRTFCDARVKLQLANLHVKLTLLSWCGSQTDISIIFGSSCFSIWITSVRTKLTSLLWSDQELQNKKHKAKILTAFYWLNAHSKILDWSSSHVLSHLPESYREPWREEGVQVTEVAGMGLGLLGSISVFTTSLCGELLVLEVDWLWLLTPGSNNALNLGSSVGLWGE